MLTEIANDFLIAAILTFNLPAPKAAPKPCWDALKRYALRMEITSPQERWIDDFNSECRYVRRYQIELQNCPPMADCERFPSFEILQETRKFYCTKEAALESRRGMRLSQYEE